MNEDFRPVGRKTSKWNISKLADGVLETASQPEQTCFEKVYPSSSPTTPVTPPGGEAQVRVQQVGTLCTRL